MLYSYAECIKEHGSDYQVKVKLADKSLFKLESGIYSDKSYADERAIIQKKYPYGIYGLNSAFYYQGLTDVIPRSYYLVTDKNSTKIKDKRIQQIFENANIIDVGIEVKLAGEEPYRVYSKERLLVDLIRYKHRLSSDYYREIIKNYREIIDDLDIQEIQDILYEVPKSAMIMKILKAEVF